MCSVLSSMYCGQVSAVTSTPRALAWRSKNSESAALWWARSTLAPTVWPAHVAPVLHQAATGLARASDVLSHALQLSVAVNVAGAVLLFVVRRLVRAAR